MSFGKSLLIAALALTALTLLAPATSAAKIDVVADTYHIVDGDTLDAFPVGRIRVADIDTPETGQPGYSESKEAMRAYTEGKRVYLDVDEEDVDDNYQRLVAVVWVRHNSTHLINVNRALVEADLAVVDDFPNEFDPETWPLYLALGGPELPTVFADANRQFQEALGDLADAEAALDAAEGDLADAVAERDAALAELERVSAFLNGSVPASDAVYGELNQTRADLEASQAALAASDAQRAADRAGLQAEVESATASATGAIVIGAVAAVGAGAGAFVVGRRSGRP